MADIVGGLRARLIRESLFKTVHESLADLGWFDPTRPHLPVRFVSRAQNHNEQIVQNTAALSDENMNGEELELGSGLTEYRWTFYIDFFADSDALGLHFIRDVKDILEGRMTAIGRNNAAFDVYDYTQATPPILFSCLIDEVEVAKSHGFLKPWLEHWYACGFVVVDHYNRDDG